MELKQYIHSDKADELGIDNTPVADMADRANKFLYDMVEPLELLFHPHSIIFHSGYRCTKLNTVLKGKTFSQHLRANALDFHVDNFSVDDAYRVIRHSSLRFDQLILEGKEDKQWIHISYNTDLVGSKQRMEALELPNP